jgi:hypothetical protein
MSRPEQKIRAAIYARKSTPKGRQLEFAPLVSVNL